MARELGGGSFESSPAVFSALFPDLFGEKPVRPVRRVRAAPAARRTALRIVHSLSPSPQASAGRLPGARREARTEPQLKLAVLVHSLQNQPLKAGLVPGSLGLLTGPRT